jgi:TolA-binding protein
MSADIINMHTNEPGGQVFGVDDSGAAYMNSPRWKWEWNLNTIVVLLGFASGFVAWGYTLSNFGGSVAQNANEIRDLAVRVTANEVGLRRVDNHELRLTSVEKQLSDSASSIKDIQTTVNKLATDTQVAKEILQRIEATQNREADKPPR